MYTVKRLEISGKKRPLWTVVDATGREAFTEVKTIGKVIQAWSTKRQANKIAEWCNLVGVHEVWLKIKATNFNA